MAPHLQGCELRGRLGRSRHGDLRFVVPVATSRGATCRLDGSHHVLAQRTGRFHHDRSRRLGRKLGPVVRRQGGSQREELRRSNRRSEALEFDADPSANRGRDARPPGCESLEPSRLLRLQRGNGFHRLQPQGRCNIVHPPHDDRFADVRRCEVGRRVVCCRSFDRHIPTVLHHGGWWMDRSMGRDERRRARRRWWWWRRSWKQYLRECRWRWWWRWSRCRYLHPGGGCPRSDGRHRWTTGSWLCRLWMYGWFCWLDIVREGFWWICDR
ncbi:unannotated protein [freshwater metagenome]|uniref:Unannotated protein n=1 Tax=freshwater metagenome TaxID=449393 RepID=A0A6J6ES34_9ZZZZ